MIQKTVLLFLFASSFVSAQNISKEGAERHRTIAAFSPGGQVELPAVALRVNIQHAGRAVKPGNMVVVYDPSNGYYFWHLNPIDISETQDITEGFDFGPDALYISTAGLFHFRMPAGDLIVLGRFQRAASLDDAESAAIDELRRNLPVFERRGYDPGYREVNLAPSIGRTWACAEDDLRANCSFGAKRLVSISQVGENWRVVARNRWDEEITLDSKFALISCRRIGAGEK